MRSATMRLLGSLFITECSAHNLSGVFKVNDYKKKEITLLVGPKDENGRNPTNPLSSLSGGERSRAMLCFINSLWQLSSSPFRCLDEWDVFVDDVARPAMESMIVSSIINRKFKCFLISPRQSTLRHRDGNNNLLEEQERAKKLTYITVEK